MTADPDDADPGDPIDAGGRAPTRGVSARGRRTREAAAAGRPASGPSRGPSSSSAWLEGTERRLTIVVGGAGFGKSTLAARVAAGATDRPGTRSTRRTAISGRSPPASSPRCGSACRTCPTTCRTRSRARSTPTDDAAVTGQATGGGRPRDRRPPGRVSTVTSSSSSTTSTCSSGATGAWRFVEALVRLAPPGLHLARHVPRRTCRSAIERLRGQGQVVDLGGTTLAFTVDEIDALLDILLADEGLAPAARGGRGGADPRGDRRLAGGRPARRRGVPHRAGRAATRRASSIDSSARRARSSPTSPRRSWPRASPSDARRSSARAVHFDRFSAPAPARPSACRTPARTLDGLAPRALFLQPLPGRGRLVRPPRPHPRVRAHPAAASTRRDPRRSTRGGRLVRGPRAGSKRRSTRGCGRATRGALARFLSDHGPTLVLGGATRQVIEATALAAARRARRRASSAPAARRTWSAGSGARRTRRSTGRPARAAGSTRRRPGGWASSTALRGAYDEALAIYAPGRGRRQPAGRRGAARRVDRVGPLPPRRRRAEQPGGRRARRARARPPSAMTPGAGRGPHGDGHERTSSRHDPMLGRPSDYDGGARRRRTGRRRAPGRPDPQRRGARWSWRRGRFEEALEILDEAVRHRRHRRLRGVPRPGPRQPGPGQAGHWPVRGGDGRLHRRPRDLRADRLAVGRLRAHP